jgi:hypothetical protein
LAVSVVFPTPPLPEQIRMERLPEVVTGTVWNRGRLRPFPGFAWCRLYWAKAGEAL